MSRPFRLWVRCPACDQNPDGFMIVNTYIQFASAVRAGRRLVGERNFHIDHTDPEFGFKFSDMEPHSNGNGNGKHLYCAKRSEKRSARDNCEHLLSLLRL